MVAPAQLKTSISTPVIAVVDGDAVTRELVDQLLTTAGYRTVPWSRAKDAHDMIRARRPDLVILDVWLDKCEAGGMVLAMMEHDPATRNIPVIVCSGHSSALQKHAAQFREKGHAVIEKPIEPSRLLATIDSLLRSDRRS